MEPLAEQLHAVLQQVSGYIYPNEVELQWGLLIVVYPERFYEILFTPNLNSAMAMFGFVYAWYLMAVLLLEIWFDYRKDLVLWARQERGLRRWIHLILTLGSTLPAGWRPSSLQRVIAKHPDAWRAFAPLSER